MAQVVNTGTGTHGIGSHVFRPGATDCDDVAVLDHLTADSPDHIEVHGHVVTSGEGHAPEADPSPDEDEDAVAPAADDEDGDASSEAEGSATSEQDEPEPVASEETEAASPEAVAEHVAREHTVEASGPVVKSDLEPGFPCRAEGCDKGPFTTSSGRASHERIKHPDLET